MEVIELMESDAPGQFLGYAIQFPRALLQLLNAGPGDSVGVEVHGDVSNFKSDGTTISEEDKSSLRGNPVTDKSTNLWKTFYNWAIAVQSGSINVDQTTFVLYVNYAGNKGLVHDFHAFGDATQAGALVQKIKSQIEPLKSNHDIYSYYDYLINVHTDLFIQILVRFQFEANEGDLIAPIIAALKKKHVPESQIGLLLERISGWTVNTLLQRISSRQRGLVSWDEFDRQFINTFERVRTKELIDTTVTRPPSGEAIGAHMIELPVYLKQLGLIGLEEQEKMEAVTNYLKAEANRTSWIDNGILDEESAEDFEHRLTNFWTNERKAINLTQPSLSEERRGQLLLYQCLKRQETIRELTPPASTIPGTYHALADQPVLGWHADWGTYFDDNQGE